MSSAMTYLPLGRRSASTGHALADAGEVVERQLDAGGVRDRQQVQHRVGRAAQRDHHGDGVLEGLARHDAPRRQAVGSISRAPPRRRGGSHRASRPTSPPAPSCSAGSCPSASIAEAIVLAVYMPPQEPAPGKACCSTSASSASVILPAACWPTASNTETMSHRLAAPVPGQDGAAVDEDRRAIQPGERHQAAGHVLVAAADGDQAVEALARRRRSRSSRRSPRARPASSACPARAHRDAVGDGDGVEDDALAAGLVDARGRLPGRARRCACCTA